MGEVNVMWGVEGDADHALLCWRIESDWNTSIFFSIFFTLLRCVVKSLLWEPLKDTP